jgi:insulysin
LKQFGVVPYLSHWLGHESNGSLLEELKRRNWGNQLLAGPFENLSTFCVFGVEIDLTVDG